MNQVGDAMPRVDRTITLTAMIAYAGATWDWHKLHYDPDYLSARGLPAPVVDGQVFGAHFTTDLESWLGPVCFIRELGFTFRNLMYAGETVRTSGRIVAIEGDDVRVELEATILASHFGAERPAVQPAHAVVRVGAIDGDS